MVGYEEEIAVGMGSNFLSDKDAQYITLVNMWRAYKELDEIDQEW